MSQVVATYRSIEASYMSIQATSQRDALAVKIGGDKKRSNILNTQQQQIVDDVGISQEALQKFEDAQLIAKQLQDYLDYLNGRKDEVNVQIVPTNQEASVEIAGRSTKLSASIEVATYKEETLQITADLDDEGNLTSLSIDKTTISAEYISANISFEDTQFYARA